MNSVAEALPVQEDSSPGTKAPLAIPLDQLDRHRPGHPDELLRHRFLCRGGGLLFVGPTGVGKSSFTLQCLIEWSLGRPAFGIVPARPLRAVVVQAENDQGDMAEMADGVFAGLGLSDEDKAKASAAVKVCHVNDRSGPLFCCEVVRALLKEHRPDIIVIDPALAYLGGEANSAKDVGAFLRNQLQPLLTEFNCGGIVVHHTNKPPSGREKSDWQAGDHAYLGSGSAEFANWARAVLAIQSIGSHEVFRLVVGKRGSRLGWKEADGTTKAFSKLIGHSLTPGAICWREVDQSEVPEKPTKAGKPAPTAEAFLALVPLDRPINKELLLDKAIASMGRRNARAMLASCLDESLLYEWKIPRKPLRPLIQISRIPQPEPTLV